MIEMNREMKAFMFAALALLMTSACFMIYDSEYSEASDLVEDDLTINVGETKTFYWVDDLHEDWYDLIQAAGGNYSIGLTTTTSWGNWVNSSKYDLEATPSGIVMTAKSTLSTGKYYISLVIMDEGGVDELEDLLYGVTVKAASTTNYTVTFSISSGSSYGSLSHSSITVPSGTTYSKSGNNLVFKSGSTTLYTIIPTPKAATSSYTYDFGSWSSTSGTITANKSITCSFTRTAVTTSYTCYLYYDANGGSGAPSTQSYTGTSTSNHLFTISSTTPSKSGYTFLGWSTSSSASSASYSGGDSISVGYKSSKTLYAVWQEQVTTYTITIYKGNWDSFKLLSDGTKYTTSSHTYTINAGTTIDVDWYGKDAESGSGTGYTYTTTYTNHEYNMASSLYGASLGDSVTPTGNAKYYPATQMTSNTVYTYSYTIKYNANGGSGAPGNTTDTSSSSSKSITLSSTIPTRSGYNFLGWSKSSTATSASYSAGGSYSFDYGTTNLYAVWKEATITVSGTPDAYGVVGSAWSFKPTVSVDGCSVTISGASWLSANGTNVSGTPTTSGTYNVTLTFSKTGYTSATKTFSITVLSALSFESSPTGGAIIYAV